MYHLPSNLDDPSLQAMPRGAVAWGDDPACLRAILSPACALAIWGRPLPPGLADLVARIDTEAVDDIDAVVNADAATLEAAVLLGAAGYERETALALAREVGTTADRLVAVVSTGRLRVRLEIVGTDACRRFHADMVTVRLLVTLRGPGTQWIEPSAPDAIAQMTTGAVAIFKGRLLREEPAVLHRSPPVAGTGVRRLVLVVDPA